MKDRVAPEVEVSVVNMAFEYPAYGHGKERPTNCANTGFWCLVTRRSGVAPARQTTK